MNKQLSLLIIIIFISLIGITTAVMEVGFNEDLPRVEIKTVTSGSASSGGVSNSTYWLNASDYLYINSSYPQSINISGNATFGGGALFKGSILGDLTLDYKNIRFGVYSNTPRIILDNGSSIGQIDYVGNTMRFILNDTSTGHTRARMRINSTGVRIGENLDHANLKVWGNIEITGNLDVGGCIIYNSTGTPVTLGDCV